MKIISNRVKTNLIIFLGALLISISSYGQSKDNDTVKKVAKPKYEGLQLKINDNWKLKFSGQINAYYVNTSQKENASKNIKKETFNSIQNGINQATFSLNPVYTTDNGTTITGTFGLAFGITNHGVDASKNQALGFGFSSVDIRQASIRIATPKAGTFLIGKDFGTFGLDAIIYDVSFYGIGANYSYDNPKNTTLAGIGYGYIFVDKISQFGYTTPSFLGGTSSLSLSVYEPLATYDFYGAFGQTFEPTDNPNGLGVQGKFAFNKTFNKASVYFSSSFISQQVSDNNTGAGLNGLGIDAFLKLNFKGLTLSGYYYNADGIGDAGIMFGPAIKVNNKVQTVKSDGYYAQVMYAISKSPITLGINYGASRVKDNVVGNTVKYSDSATRFTNSITYSLNPYLTLKSEYTIQSAHKVFAPGAANVFSLGGYFTF